MGRAQGHTAEPGLGVRAGRGAQARRGPSARAGSREGEQRQEVAQPPLTDPVGEGDWGSQPGSPLCL